VRWIIVTKYVRIVRKIRDLVQYGPTNVWFGHKVQGKKSNWSHCALYLIILGGVNNHCSLYAVVWRDSVVWWSGGNTALWLVETHDFLYALNTNFQAMDSLWPMTAPYFPLVIKPRNLAKLQCKVQSDNGWPLPICTELCLHGVRVHGFEFRV